MATERVEREKREAEEAAARQVAEQQAAADAKEANLKQTLQRKQQVGTRLPRIACLLASAAQSTSSRTWPVVCAAYVHMARA